LFLKAFSYLRFVLYLRFPDTVWNDRAKLTLGSLCNTELVNNGTEDESTFSIYFRVCLFV